MSHLARGPASAGIDSKANGTGGRRGVVAEPNSPEEAVA